MWSKTTARAVLSSLMSMRRYSTGFWLSIVIIAGLTFGFFYRQPLRDHFFAMTYQPTSAMSEIVARAGLSGVGKLYLYASQPQIEDRDEFTENCGQHEVSTAILGCYSNGRIYLFSVSDKELDGIMDVTAAHEMLHAAYARLSSQERSRVDSLLAAEAAKLTNNEVFKQRIAVYDELNRADYLSELHSVIGTEVSNLGPSLAEYYSRYFDNRQAVTSLYEAYSGVFEKLQSSAETLAASLDAQAAAINANAGRYNTGASQLNTDIAYFNQRAKAGDFTSQADFASERQALARRVDDLESLRATINNAITAYNRDKSTYESLSTHLTKLNNSIDSSLVALPRV